MYRGAPSWKGPVKRGKGMLFKMDSTVCVCPLSNPVRMSRDSNSISCYSSGGVQLRSAHRGKGLGLGF